MSDWDGYVVDVQHETKEVRVWVPRPDWSEFLSLYSRRTGKRVDHIARKPQHLPNWDEVLC